MTQQNWTSGNSLVIIITGSGKRVAESYNGSSSAATLLHVEYATGPPPNTPPVVNAGADDTVAWGYVATLDATVTDDGLPAPPGMVTTLWEQTGGAGVATFTDATAIDTTVSFSTDGIYTLRLTADDGEWQPLPFDEVTITVVINQAPTVSVAAVPPVTLPAGAVLDGTVTDDGLPVPVTTAWSKFSGPGTVTFGDPNAVDTTASFSLAGTYVLRLTATDVDLGDYVADVTVIVNPAPVPPTITSQPTNQTVTEPEPATFSVVATGDAPLTYQWRRNGADMPGEVSASVTLSSTTVGDSGDVFDVVVVSNAAGSVTSASATLTVNAAPQPPSITTQPTNQVVTAPDPATFSVVATGDTPLTYQWRRKGADMPGEVSASVTLSSTTVGDSGDWFDVVVSNAVDSITSASATLTVEVLPPPPPAPPTVFERRVSTGNDDAEESSSGSVNLSSSDLELVQESSTQTVGIRFQNVGIPPEATVVNAWLQFQADESHSGGTSLTIAAQASANPGTFSSSSGNVSSRPRLTETVSWSPPAWSTGNQGPAQQTPNLAPVIQAVVTQQNWTSGNSLVIIITGSGKRVAESYNGSSSAATLLHVEYATGPPPNTPPVVNAGADDTVAWGYVATLDATVTDDGLPAPPGMVTTLWEQTGGPTGGVATFTDATAIDTTVTFSISILGTYTLRLTADDGEWQPLPFDEVTITVVINQAPTVSVAAVPPVTLPSGAVLDGTVTDDGLPVPVTIAWSKFSGPGTVTFGDQNAVDTTASFSTDGTYVLHLTATDVDLGDSVAAVTVIVNPAPPNQPPTVSVAPVPPVTLPAAAVLDGTVTDDGLPAPVTTTWSKFSGPGTVTFGDLNAVDTTASFSLAGTYVLRLTATDVDLGDYFAAVTVEVLPPPPGPQTIFFDDLQQNEPFTLWVESNEFDWTVKAPEEKQVPGSASGNRVGHADNCDNGCFLTLAQTINLSPYESATLSFWRYVDTSLDSGEYLRVEISDGSAWTTIFEWTHGSGDDDQWHLESYDIPVTHLVAGFSLRFVSRSSSTREDNEIDDVLLEGMLLIGGNYRPVADAGSDQTVTDQDGDGLETVTLDGSASSDPEGQIVDWEWAEGGNVLGNGETLDAVLLVGNHTVSLTVTDDGGATATDEVLVRVLPQGGGDPTILEVRVSTGNDDAEEQASGSVGRSSSDLELVQESSTQTVGIRFQGVDIPPGAVIVNAWLQFQADESHSGGTSLTITAQASANPVTFSSTNGNISSRPRLTETVSWLPPAWSTGAQGPAQQTPDLALVIQAVVNQQNWTSGNSLVIIITGSGKRVAESYNGSSSAAALLHVEYY